MELEEVNGRRHTPENLFLQAFTQFQPCAKLTRGILTALIERIYIDENDGVKIIFRYKDEYKTLCDFVERRAAE